MEAAFYCVTDARYFLGAVGMINSLRLQGHDEPIYLLDLGLTTQQRRLLAPEVEFVEAPSGIEPWLAKTIAPLRHPAEVMVLIDVDMIVTRPLGELIERAREGTVVAFENPSDRFVAAWGEILDLGPLRRGPYVCSGFVAMAGDPGYEILRLLDAHQARVEVAQGFYGVDDPSYPFRFPEQDVLNAVLAATDSPPCEALPSRLAPMPPFAGLRVLDDRALRCAYADGEEPYLVHHYQVKPWLERTHDGVYSRLLRRSLGRPDLPVKVPRSMVPRRFRSGSAAYADRKWTDLRQRLRWRLDEPLGGKLSASSRR